MLDLDIRLQRKDFALAAEFTAPAGVTAVFGRSGAGKTTLLRAVAGLARPDAGHIRVGERTFFDATTDLPTARRRVGYVFQDARLFPHMSVAQNLRYGGQHDLDRVIDLLGLGTLLDRRTATLSGGEAQRVAIGRALASDPALLILDEPLSSLDAPRKAEVMPYLERLRDTAQMPMIYVSHDMAEVARLATTLVLLSDGKVLRAGPLEDVLSDPAAMPQIGVREAGAVISATVARHDRADGLTHLTALGGELVVPGPVGTPGQVLRLRVPASDIILSRDAPAAISALNVVPVTVTGLHRGQGPGVAVSLQAGDDKLLARITRRSADRLSLEPGARIFAILKATAVAPANLGPRA